MSAEIGTGRITTTPKPDIGLSDTSVQGVAAILSRLLADEHVLYTRLRNYHWNLVGMAFGPLHALFQQQYEALADDIDDIRAHPDVGTGSAGNDDRVPPACDARRTSRRSP